MLCIKHRNDSHNGPCWSLCGQGWIPLEAETQMEIRGQGQHLWREEKEADWGAGGRKCSGSPKTAALGTPWGPLSQNDPLEFSPVGLIWTGPYTSSLVSYWMWLTWEGIWPWTRRLFATEAKPLERLTGYGCLCLLTALWATREQDFFLEGGSGGAVQRLLTLGNSRWMEVLSLGAGVHPVFYFGVPLWPQRQVSMWTVIFMIF